MPPAEFDEFTKALAAAPSRRAVLRLLTSGAAAFVAGRALGSFPEQAMASSSACKDSNELSTTCEGLLKYVYDCGVFCPNREHHRGKGGCTVPNARGKLPLSTTTYKRNGQGGWCASKTVNATFTVNPKVTVLSWSPSGPACCPNECVAAVRDVLKQVADHEQEHVKIIKDEAGAATKAWTNRTFTRCATTKKAAKLQLDVEIETAFQRQRINLETKFAQEPPQAWALDCAKWCTPKTRGNKCCNGSCVPAGSKCIGKPSGNIWCNCNKTCYANLSACTRECKESIACFTGICTPVEKCPPG